MKFFPWQKKEEFFTAEQKQQLVDAIQKAEKRTSGEVRLFVESKCRFIDPMDRAKEIFLQLAMEKTDERNATLVYVAVKDRQAAILGDAGIHQKVGQQYWEAEVKKMLLYFRQHQLTEGLCQVINDIGEALHLHFPYSSEHDKNELPDEIIFGK
ncbi:MAG TPA: TPM domain-containing protein [Flavisolibacter sp.]|nr:TPM domain-containing protein [Flavisolibacter sp.]